MRERKTWHSKCVSYISWTGSWITSLYQDPRPGWDWTNYIPSLTRLSLLAAAKLCQSLKEGKVVSQWAAQRWSEKQEHERDSAFLNCNVFHSPPLEFASKLRGPMHPNVKPFQGLEKNYILNMWYFYLCCLWAVYWYLNHLKFLIKNTNKNWAKHYMLIFIIPSS